MSDKANPDVGTDVEIIDDSQLEIVEAAIRSTDYRDVDQLVTVEDPQATADAIVARILAAMDDATPEEAVKRAFAGNQAIGAKALIGVPLTVKAVRWARSRFQQGAAIFAIVDVTRLDTGDDLVVTSSARNVLAQLMVCQRVGGFPVEGLAFAESATETANGFKPMWLEWVKGHPGLIAGSTDQVGAGA